MLYLSKMLLSLLLTLLFSMLWEEVKHNTYNKVHCAYQEHGNSLTNINFGSCCAIRPSQI